MNLRVRLQFKRLAALLQAQAAVAGGLGHAATVGALREVVVRNFLRPHLPETIGIHSGIIIDAQGHESRQQDIILVDRSFPTISVGADDGVALIVAESVLATIEVKSRLDSAELRTSMESIAQTRRMSRSGELFYSKLGAEVRGPMQPILAYIFAFDGIALSTLQARMVDFCTEQSDGGIGPEAICVLPHGAILRAALMPTVRMGQGEPKKSILTLPPGPGGMGCTSYELKEDALLKFYSRLRDDVVGLKVLNYDLDPYFGEAH
ncbi:hypothetical protein LJR118_005378 [Acidovorax sp. LjRoot118]|uniref:DUF6602 domain-containing protein n=1 Tax=Acidovorax sp. LjRoot118 TaxID=3342256 RepID=UPI003ECE0E71